MSVRLLLIFIWVFFLVYDNTTKKDHCSFFFFLKKENYFVSFSFIGRIVRFVIFQVGFWCLHVKGVYN